MPFIAMDLDKIQEAKPVPNGMYDLVIDACEETVSSKGKPMYKMRLSIDGHEDAPSVFNYQGLPSADDEPKAQEFKALMIKRLAAAFGVKLDSNGFDTTALAIELTGKRGRCELTQEEYEGTLSNKLKLPMIKDTTVGKGTPPKTAKR